MRINKCIKFSFCFLIILSLIFSLCPISVFADGNVTILHMPCARPYIDNNSGYIEVFWKNSNDDSYVDVVVWSFTPLENSSNQDFLPTANQLLTHLSYNRSNVQLTFKANEYCDGYFARTYMSNKGDYKIHTAVMDGTTDPYVYNLSDSNGYSVRGVHYYGNLQTVGNQLSSSENFSVLYAEESSISLNLGTLVTIVQALYESIDGLDDEIIEKIEGVINSINSFEGSFDEFVSWYKLKFEALLTYCDQFLTNIWRLVENSDEIVSWMPAFDNHFFELKSLLQEVWLIELDSNGVLYEIKGTLDAILEVLNAGQNEPTLKNPNQGIDEAFSDVNGWFDGLDGLGGQLEQNKADNADNLAQAGNVISGFFSVVPVPIIVALVFCAIMILVCKVIGR